MKRIIWICCALFLGFLSVDCFAQGVRPKVILLVAEQNIEGPQRAWWLSEVDLSVVETTVAKKIISQGIEVIELSDVFNIKNRIRPFAWLT